MVTVKEKSFVPLIPASLLEERIAALASQINQDYSDRNPVFVAVLNGAFMFAAQLLKSVTVPCEISFIRLASYQNTSSTGNVKQIIGLSEDLTDRDVIILEDIVDTGLTMHGLIAQLIEKQARSVEVATLLTKPDALQIPVSVKYTGFEIANRFVVGYGLDYDGYGRNLDCVFVLSESEG